MADINVNNDTGVAHIDNNANRGNVSAANNNADIINDAQNANDTHNVNDVLNAESLHNANNNNYIKMTLDDGRYLIMNTLLTFCVSSMSNALKMNVIQLIVLKFSEKEIIDAKHVLCENSKDVLIYQQRRDSAYRSEKFVHAEDIYDGLKKLSDNNTMPLYVTDGYGLSRLPKVDAEDITSAAIAERMASFEQKISMLDDSVTSILLRSMDNTDRIKQLEIPNVPYQSDTAAPRDPSVPSIPRDHIGSRMPLDPAIPSMPRGHAVSSMQAGADTPTLSREPSVPSKSRDPAVPSVPPDLAVPSMPRDPVVASVPRDPSVPSDLAIPSMPRNPAIPSMPRYHTVASVARNAVVPSIPRDPAVQSMPRDPVAASEPRDSVLPHVPLYSAAVSRVGDKDGYQVAGINKMMKRVSRMRIRGTAKDCSLKAAPPRTADVFAANFDPDTTEDDIRDYLMSKSFNPIEIKQLSHVWARYKSYKISFNNDDFMRCFSEDIWPDMIDVRKYVPPRRPSPGNHYVQSSS